MTELALLGILTAGALGCPEISREFSGAVSCSLHCPSRSNISRPSELTLDVDGDGNLDAVALVCPVSKEVSRQSEVPVYLPVFSAASMDHEAAHAPEGRVSSGLMAPGASNLLAVIFGSSPKKFRATARKALIERTWSLGVVHLEKPQAPLKDWTGEQGDIIPAPKPRGEAIIVRSGEVRDAVCIGMGRNSDSIRSGSGSGGVDGVIGGPSGLTRDATRDAKKSTPGRIRPETPPSRSGSTRDGWRLDSIQDSRFYQDQ